MSKKINIISPFGPKLAKIKLSKKVVNDIKSNKPPSVSKTRPYGCSVKYG